MGKLGNVAETFLSRKNFDEGTEVYNSLYCSMVDLAALRLLDDCFNKLLGFLGCSVVLSIDHDCSIVIDVDLSTRLLCNGSDGLSTCSDYSTDLIFWNLKGKDLWSKWAYLSTWSRKNITHNGKDVHPAFLSLGKSLLHDFRCNARNLDIHLESCDTVSGSCYLEVHVSKMVLFTKDI